MSWLALNWFSILISLISCYILYHFSKENDLIGIFVLVFIFSLISKSSNIVSYISHANIKSLIILIVALGIIGFIKAFIIKIASNFTSNFIFFAIVYEFLEMVFAIVTLSVIRFFTKIIFSILH